MPAAGEYRYALQRMTLRQPEADDGGPPDLWDEGDQYRCAIDELSTVQRIQAGIQVQTVICTVRLRQFPTLNVGDRLRDNLTGELYDVEGIRNGDNELICDCVRKRPEAPGQ